MSRQNSHINSAVKILQSYKWGNPFSLHLKDFFKGEKKYGSKDRKQIAERCYNYLRLCKMLPEITPEAVETAAVIFETASNESIRKRNLDFRKIFPWKDALSSEIDFDLYAASLLIQPLFFLRIRPGKEIKITEKLAEQEIAFEDICTSCIALQPAIKTDEILKLNRDAVVQDRSSQAVFDYLNRGDVFLPKQPTVWDCCAASGGKSILLHDILHGNFDLTVSDIRVNILHNLANRFKDAGIKKYRSFVADLSQTHTNIPDQFDIVICDVPCTGSGTWSRTPEQIFSFREDSIAGYQSKQKLIACNAASALKPGGLFFYITCSVFKTENEAVVSSTAKACGLRLIHQEYIKGYQLRADTLFTAVLKKIEEPS